MKTCKNCSTVTEDNINFCPYCGGNEFITGDSIDSSSSLAQGYTINDNQLTVNINGNIPLGVLGAFLFSIVGVVLYFVIYRLGYIAGISGFVMFVLAQYGYKFFSKGNTNVSIVSLVVSVITMSIMIFVAECACLTYEIFEVYDGYGLNITLGEALEIIPELFEDSEMSAEITSDLVFAYGLGFLCIISNIITVVKNRKALKR
ncbi:MAG: hypothetical protein IJ462_03445 [Clostridia bacterium]|nr:hypothetical protein [Clostridia bacterium]